MSNKVVLLDLENNAPTAQLFRDILQHYSTLYIFNAKGHFEFALADLTELASWITSGQVVVLDTLAAQEKEFEYAVVVGQLLAMIETDSHVEVISAMDTSQILVQMLVASGFESHLIQIEREQIKPKFNTPSVSAILANPHLQQIKKYCDVLAQSSGKPNTITKLKNSLSNILQVDADEAKHLVGMLINLKLVKAEDDQISFRKKVLKQWQQIDLTETHSNDSAHSKSAVEKVDSLLAKLNIDAKQVLQEIEEQQSVHSAQKDLFKNFEKIDPVQMEVIRKLNELKSEKPKDIYALRDLLERLFPKSDVRLLLKEMIDKGYIYWNGHAVIYSHEMFLN
jgi:hypothetical protein